MRSHGNITCDIGINWYYEQEGVGPDVILIPDGFGDCGLFDLAISKIAAAGFRVTTMDMPGMSRTTTALPDTYIDVTAQKLAKYTISLMDALKIERATVWGCSSGGSAVLALALDFPDRIRSAMVHEAPTRIQADITSDIAAISADDMAIAKYFTQFLLPHVVGDLDKWTALDPKVHARLDKNYGVWVRGYPWTIPLSTPLKALEESVASHRAPIDWTVGYSTHTGSFYDNIVAALRAGIDFSLLPGQHFPYVSHVDAFAEYVITTARKYI